MRLFLGSLLLTCMLFFDEIDASGLRQVRTKAKKKDQEASSADHFATSRAHWHSVPTHNQLSLGQRALDLHENPLDIQEYSYQQSSEEPILPKRKSRKKKDIDLNIIPSEAEATKQIRDLNTKVYISKDTKTTREITQAKFGEGTNIMIDSLQVKEKVPRDVQKRERASLAHFHERYGYVPPPVLAKQLGWPSRGSAAAQFLPQPYGQFGVPGQYGHGAPPLPPPSQGHPGRSGIDGSAGFPFPPYFKDQSGGSGAWYPVPTFPVLPWGSYGDPGSGSGK